MGRTHRSVREGLKCIKNVNPATRFSWIRNVSVSGIL